MTVDTEGRTHKPRNLPVTIKAACKEVAAGVIRERAGLRYDKIVAARTRIANGYYNSDHVVRTVAARLIEDGALG